MILLFSPDPTQLTILPPPCQTSKDETEDYGEDKGMEIIAMMLLPRKCPEFLEDER